MIFMTHRVICLDSMNISAIENLKFSILLITFILSYFKLTIF